MSIAYGSHALGLGPANPTRTYLASEPSGLRRPGFPPGFSLLIPASALPRPPPPLTGRLRRLRGRSPTKGRLASPSPRLRRRASAPVNCRRAGARPVSCYALFQGWLLLSQPPGCLSTRTSLHTQPALRGLSRRSRLFPSRRRSLAPAVSLPRRAPAHSAFAGGRYPRRALAPTARYLTGAAREAAPQCISGRTSYLRVRLAFHPYPQLLQPLCNAGRFGPPRGGPPASPWPWVAHPVSGPPGATVALLRLACAPAPGLLPLSPPRPGNSPAHSSIGTPSGAERPL